MAAFGVSATEAATPVVIAHPEVSTQQLSRESVWAMFGMNIRHWPDGQRVQVFVLSSDAPLHKQFATDVLGTYPYKLDRIWKRLVFSGTGSAPIRCSDEAEMRQRVQSTPGAIGYLMSSDSAGGLRVIEVE